MKKLTKSTTNKNICGVCAGIANYFNIDTTVVRVAWAILSICTAGVGIGAYILAALIMPYDNEL